jgi:DNA topoisomerase-1
MGFSVAQTMSVAQKLYEAGKITYMRTDSVNLSSLALSGSKKTIIAEYGEKYAQTRNFKTKTKGAQEAHEAIRPTYLENKSTTGSVNERRLYELIWKRTIASQMSDALLEKTVITISLSNHDRKFIATGEVIKFDGFIKVYKESTDDDAEEKQVLLPEVKVGQVLEKYVIHANQKFTQRPARFTEASLVKKLEELGIGRPSTYAPTISTIQNRGYVSRESTPGINRQVEIITLDNGKISEKVKTETSGSEKAKLVPSDIGMVVNDFLVENFKDIINFNFTASVEKQFDEIADGHLEWRKMIDDFYGEFHEKVESTLSETTKTRGERALGEDPVSGDTVYAKIGPYGPMVQIGVSNGEVKPKFASLLKAQRIETITLEDALSLFKLPRTVGTFEEKEVVSAIGRYGAYIRHDNKFYSLGKDEDDPLTIAIDRAIEVIEEKREQDKKKVIKVFPEDKDLQVLNGRWGPYLKFQKENFRIPKKTDPESLTYEDCLKLIEEGRKKKSSKSK